jgi:hypothetical protein
LPRIQSAKEKIAVLLNHPTANQAIRHPQWAKLPLAEEFPFLNAGPLKS